MIPECSLDFKKYSDSALKFYGSAEAAVEAWLSNNREWPSELLEFHEDSNNKAPAEDQRNTRNYINLTAEKKQQMFANLEADAQKYEYLATRNPDNAALQGKKEYLKRLLADLAQAKDDVKVMSYLSYASDTVKSSNAFVDIIIEKGNSAANINLIMRLYNEMKNLDILGDLNLHFDESTPEGAKALQELSELRASKENLEAKVLNSLRVMFAEKMANLENSKVKVEFRDNAEREFNRTYNGPSDKKKEAKRKYLADFMEANKELIVLKEKEYYNEYLLRIPMDLDYMQQAVNPGSLIDNELFSTLREEVMRREQVAKLNLNDKSKRAEQLFSQIEGKLEGSTTKDKMSLFMKKDKDDGSWYLLDNTLARRKEISSLKGEEYVKMQKIAKDPALMEFLDFLHILANEADSKYTKAGKLKNKKGVKIPSLHKDSYKRLFEGGVGGLVNAIKEIPKLTSKFEDQDVKGSNVTAFTDAAGKRVLDVPIYMRDSIEDNDRNFDLSTIFLMNAYNADVFQSRMESRDSIDAALIILEDKNTKVVDAGYGSRRRPILSRNKDSEGEIAYKAGTQSNLYKHIKDWKDYAIYGQGIKANKGVATLIQKTSLWTSLVNLGFNVVAGVANGMNNMSQIFLSSLTDGGLISSSDTKYAIKKYGQLMRGHVHDAIVSKNPKSLLGQLYAAYDPGSEMAEVLFKSEFSTVGSRHANLGSAFITQKAVDTPAYAIVMLSYMKNLKVVNASGKMVTKEGKETSDINEALSLAEAYEMGYKDGNLALPDFVAGTDRFGLSPLVNGNFTNDYIVRVARPLQVLSEHKFGAYSSKNKAALQRTPIGNLIYGQRGFLIPLMVSRWKGLALLGHGGFSKDATPLSQMSINERSVDTTTGLTDEGIYTTALIILRDMVNEVRKEGKLLEARKNVIGSLTQHELNKFRRAQMEVAILASLAIFANFLFHLAADEDDDEGLYMAAFFTRRLYSELRSPSSFDEFFKYFRQPAISTAMYEKIFDVFGQFFSDAFHGEFERYDSGINKDRAKLFVMFNKTIPVWNQMTKSYDFKNMNNFIGTNLTPREDR